MKGKKLKIRKKIVTQEIGLNLVSDKPIIIDSYMYFKYFQTDNIVTTPIE